MSKNTCQKNKLVQNYSLETLLIDCEYCEFWIAIHKILKKNFVLKRYKIKGENKEVLMKRSIDSQNEVLSYQKALDQINLLKSIEIWLKPKCHKLIRTSKNVYIIYDDFAGILLQKYLKDNEFDLNQKIQIMMNLTKNLIQIHRQNVAMLVLNNNLVNVVNNKFFVFIDWTFAVSLDESSKIVPIFQQFDQEGANHVLMGKKGAFDVDIRNLGLMFRQILNVNYLSRGSQLKELKELIIRMTKCFEFNNQNLLQRVMDTLQGFKKRESKQLMDNSVTKSTHSIDQLNINKIERQVNQRLKNPLCISHNNLSKPNRMIPNTEQSISNTSDISNKSRPTLKKIDHPQIKQNLIQTHKQLRKNNSSDTLMRNVRLPSQADINMNKQVKEICKIRNLAFFVLQLSQHVVILQSFQELGFMLMKYAYLTLKNSLHMTQEMEDQSQKGVKRQFVLLLTGELSKIKNLLKKITKYCRSLTFSEQMRKQLLSDNIENEEYFNDLIDQFGESQIAMSQSIKTTKTEESLNSLFWTYMVLKKKEFGDYDKFWNQVYRPGQKYYNQFQIYKEKKFGLRYIRENIKRILKKN